MHTHWYFGVMHADRQVCCCGMFTCGHKAICVDTGRLLPDATCTLAGCCLTPYAHRQAAHACTHTQTGRQAVVAWHAHAQVGAVEGHV